MATFHCRSLHNKAFQVPSTTNTKNRSRSWLALWHPQAYPVPSGSATEIPVPVPCWQPQWRPARCQPPSPWQWFCSQPWTLPLDFSSNTRMNWHLALTTLEWVAGGGEQWQLNSSGSNYVWEREGEKTRHQTNDGLNSFVQNNCISLCNWWQQNIRN